MPYPPSPKESCLSTRTAQPPNPLPLQASVLVHVCVNSATRNHKTHTHLSWHACEVCVTEFPSRSRSSSDGKYRNGRQQPVTGAQQRTIALKARHNHVHTPAEVRRFEFSVGRANGGGSGRVPDGNLRIDATIASSSCTRTGRGDVRVGCTSRKRIGEKAGSMYIRGYRNNRGRRCNSQGQSSG